ncbi:hypothetical protein H4R21_002518 [Coemansia helicoidea]|uniref:Uncharacterized protein n=1 Tax=Coemansia helicoidea TaxID=1286919 RepID=A0ACC1L756_9FUNG|nr:hypothetical protein H4R21_002518 [Coemansia helicoidea]
MQKAAATDGRLGSGSSDDALGHQQLQDPSGLGKFNLADAGYHSQTLASAVAAAVAQQQPAGAGQEQRQSPAPMYPGASTIPTNFSSGQINSPEALQQFKANFWKAHTASIDDNTPDFKTHLLPLARIKKVMKSDPDVKVQMISAEAPILFSKACEIFITEITQRAWMNAEENKRRTLQRQDVSFAAQRSEMFDFLIDVVPREEFVSKKAGAAARDEPGSLNAAGSSQPPMGIPPQQQAPQQPQPQPIADQGGVPHAQAQSAQQQSAQPVGLYGDQAFHQYYAQHLADTAGFPQAPGPTPQQRQSYYQQIEREQLQWFQRQANMGQFSGQQVAGGTVGSATISPQIQQQQIQQDPSRADMKIDHGK